MRQLLLVLLSLACAAPLHAEVIRLSEPVATDQTSESFGSEVDTTEPAMTLKTLIDTADTWVGKPVLVDTKVGKVCQKKGCFFLATQGSLSIRVSFKDYSFFVPTDTGGKTVTLSGTLTKRRRSSEQAAHFNEDIQAGDAILQPGEVYEIVATGVKIPL